MNAINHKIVHIITLVSSIWLIISCSEIDKENIPEGINLEIGLSKNLYLNAERIWVKGILFNLTGSKYIIENDFNFMSGIFFIIKDENGKSIASKLTVEPGQDTLELLSKDTLFAYGELDWYFNKYQNYTGEYTITAIFQGIKSNSVKIRFTYPEGNDKMVYEKMKEIDKKVRDNSQYLDMSLVDLENLFLEYPSSIYAPYLFNQITMSTGIPAKKEERYNNLLNVFFNNYSNSYESYYTLLNYEWYLKKVKKLSDEDVRIILKELSANKSGTLVAEIITNIFLKSNSNK